MIPLSVPTLAGNEWEYVKSCIDTGWVSSAGKYVTEFERAISQFVGAPHAVALVNGTAALHLALIVSEVQRNDIAILPNLTFVASANAVMYMNAEPVFIDVDPVHWQMDTVLLRRFLTESCERNSDGLLVRKSDQKRVKCIMPVHTLGDIGEITEILLIAREFDLSVIEDSTEALGSKFDGVNAGMFGSIGTFSFNGNKIISTGGGGVLVTADESKANLARHLSTQAKDASRGYFHDAVGYNYRMVNVLAAIGVAQLEQLPSHLKRKKAIATEYRRALSGVGDINFPAPTGSAENNHWLNTLHTEKRDFILNSLSAKQIEARPFWVPMSQLPMFRSFEYVADADISNKLYSGCVSIPSSASLSDEDQNTVINAIKECY